MAGKFGCQWLSSIYVQAKKCAMFIYFYLWQQQVYKIDLRQHCFLISLESFHLGSSSTRPEHIDVGNDTIAEHLKVSHKTFVWSQSPQPFLLEILQHYLTLLPFFLTLKVRPFHLHIFIAQHSFNVVSVFCQWHKWCRIISFK